MARKRTSIKEVVTDRGYSWIITKVKQGYDGMVRIDAKMRFREPDISPFFSEWGKLSYINRCRREECLAPLQITEY